MAVPASGSSLSLAALAAEKIENDYTNVDTSYGPYSLKDITIGGNSSGVGGESYDVTNAISPSHPDNNASYDMSEFYSYDHDFAAPACNLAYKSGQYGEFNYPVNLGAGTGIIRIEYEAYGVPDRFEFTWNGNTYISGSSSGNYDGYVGSASTVNTNNLRTALGNNTIEIYSNNQGGIYTAGRGYIEFNKNSSASTANMNVKAPLSGTQWWFSVSCPGMQVVSTNPGITPSVLAYNTSGSSDQGANTNYVNMAGNITNKGLIGDFSTTGTITAKGFVWKLDTATAPFIIGDSGVTNVPNVLLDSYGGSTQTGDTAMNTTGIFLQDTNDDNDDSPPTNTLIPIGTPSIGAVTTSNIDEDEFDVSYSLSSCGGRNMTFRAYATNAAGTTYSNMVNQTTLGEVAEHGVVYCNQAFSSTPSASLTSGVLNDSTGSQFTQVAGTTTTTGTKTDTIQESSVGLQANSTYRIRSVTRQGSTITHGSISSFTVPASNDYTATLTTGWGTFYTTVFKGYVTSPVTAGSLSNTSFNGKTITGLYYQDQSGTDYIYIYFSSTKPSFSAISINGQSLGASSTWTSASSVAWRKTYSNNLFGSNNTIVSITASY